MKIHILLNFLQLHLYIYTEFCLQLCIKLKQTQNILYWDGFHHKQVGSIHEKIYPFVQVQLFFHAEKHTPLAKLNYLHVHFYFCDFYNWTFWSQVRTNFVFFTTGKPLQKLLFTCITCILWTCLMPQTPVLPQTINRYFASTLLFS